MKLHEAVALTYAAVGQELSDAALELICADLAAYPPKGVAEALQRCRREVRGRLSLADILDRIPCGHPGVEEAWSLVCRAIGDERATVILTEPMRAAFYAAEQLVDDEVGARMAFKEVYARDVALARQSAAMPEWSAILGHDPAERDAKITQAVTDGRIEPQRALTLMAHHDEVTLESLMALAPPEVRAKLGELQIKRIDGRE